MINGLDLDAIKLRYCQATPGQWRHGNDGQSIVTDGEDPAPPHYGGRVVCETIGQLDRDWIIAARTDVPALVAEVERLRELAERDRLRGLREQLRQAESDRDTWRGIAGIAETLTKSLAGQLAECLDRHDDVVRVEHPDAEFIAHARTDVPALVAEVERLRERLRLTESDRDAWLHRAGRLAESLDRYEATT